MSESSFLDAVQPQTRTQQGFDESDLNQMRREWLETLQARRPTVDGHVQLNEIIVALCRIVARRDEERTPLST